MARRIFISYRRDDSVEHVGYIHRHLEREFGRGSVFRDVDSIPLGVNFADVLSEAVAKCHVLLALVGSKWLDARDQAGNRRLDDTQDYVRIEIAAALRRDIPVVPIFLEGAQVPPVDRLPADLKELSCRNGLEVRHATFQNDMDRLLGGLRALSKIKATTKARSRKPAAETKPVDRPLDERKSDTLATVSSDTQYGSVVNETKLRECWTHETTEDANFTGRSEALKRLDSWFATPSSRIIAITGIGGLGKTSLVAHWLKHRAGLDSRPLDGLFFWSIYSDRNIKQLFCAIVNFGVELGATRPTSKSDEVGAVMQVLRQKAIILFIDGLELLQEIPVVSGDGAFLSESLRELLEGICRMRNVKGLAVLTSRFSFADLAPYCGLGFRSLQLDHLSPDEGAALLEVCGVGGTDAERKSASQHFHGHPLGLRVFALTLEQQGHRDPSLLIQQVFGSVQLLRDDPLERRLKRLLEFYEKEMPRVQAAMLGIVSFFRSLAPTGAIVALARRLPGVADATADYSDQELVAVLDKLGSQHLLIGDPMAENWSCHPILRDHFRQNLLGWSPAIAKGAAGFLTKDFQGRWSFPNSADDTSTSLLTARPSRDLPRNVNELEPIVTAVELLLEIGDFDGADQLFRERLEDGNLFRQLALPGEGMRCSLGFVRDEERRGLCDRKLGKPRVAAYVRQVGIFARQAGEFDFGLTCFRDCTKLFQDLGQDIQVSISLQNWTGLLLILGRLKEAEQHARRAIESAMAAEAFAEWKGSLTYLGTALGRQGNVKAALSEFDAATKLELSAGRQVASLFGNRGVRYADLLLRIDRRDQAQWVTEANLQICRENNWQEETAQCWSVLGEISLLRGRDAERQGDQAGARQQFKNAEGMLKAAEQVFRGGHTLAQIPRVLLARCELERWKKNWESAHGLVDEALNLAGPRQMKVDHAEALLMRSRLHMEEATRVALSKTSSRRGIEKAVDDADQASQISRDCSYVWGIRDALQLLESGYRHLGTVDRANELDRTVQELTKRLADPDTAHRMDPE